MATVIPVAGEVSLITAPPLKEGLDRLIQKRPGTERKEWIGPDGEVFFYRSPGDFNPRATKFMAMRGGEEEVTGVAIFLSQVEWKAILDEEIQNLIRPPTRPDEVELRGNTHLVSDELRKLGARFDGVSWKIPKEKADEARRLIEKAVPRKMGEPLKNRVAGPCVFCGIQVASLDGFLGKNENGQPTVRCREAAHCRLRADSTFDESFDDLFSTEEIPKKVSEADPLGELLDEFLNDSVKGNGVKRSST